MKHAKQGRKRRHLLSISLAAIMIITTFFTANLVQQVMGAVTITDPAKLGPASHYNGIVFGNFHAHQSDTEGALAVGGEYAKFGTKEGQGFSVGASYHWAPGTQIGQYINPNNYPSLLLGTDDIVIGTDSASDGSWYGVDGGPLVFSESLQKIYSSKPKQLNGGWNNAPSTLETASDELVADWFSDQFSAITSLQKKYAGANEVEVQWEDFASGAFYDKGPEYYLNKTMKYGGAVDNKLLVITVRTGSTVNFTSTQPLRMRADWARAYELIVFQFPDAVNMTAGGGAYRVDDYANYNSWINEPPGSTRINDDEVDARTQIATKTVYSFPQAESINTGTFQMLGSLIAPHADMYASGGSINGQLVVDNFETENSCELHALFISPRFYDEDGEDEETASVEVEKYVHLGGAATNIVLGGAEFQLYAYKNDKYELYSDAVYKTDATGKVKIEDLPLGRYKLVETAAPDGYERNTGSAADSDTYFEYAFTLDEEDENKTVTIKRYNEPKKTRVNFVKVDADNSETTLAGAGFALVQETGLLAGQTVGQTTSDGSGKFSFANLTAGTYSLSETKVPDGYERMEDFAFQIVLEKGQLVLQSEDGKDITATQEMPYQIKNVCGETENRIVIRKHDGADLPGQQTGLPGAAFDLYRETKDGWEKVTHVGETAVMIVTDEGGLSYIDNLPTGLYRLVETTAPDGYLLENPLTDGDFPDGYAAEFTVEDDMKDTDGEPTTVLLVSVEDRLITTDVTLRKQGLWNGSVRPLAGAEFALYEVSEEEGRAYLEKMSSPVTGEDGSVSLGELGIGEYLLRETKAPTGYKPLGGDIRITVTLDPGDNQTLLVRVKLDEGASGSAVFDEVTQSVVVTDELATGRFQLKKYDEEIHLNEDGTTRRYTYLVGATFQLQRLADEGGNYYDYGAPFTSALTGEYDQNGTEIAAAKIDGLPYGTYRVVEVAYPDGYTASTEFEAVSHFTITPEMALAGDTVTTLAPNTLKTNGELWLEKRDYTTGEAVQGAEFELWRVTKNAELLDDTQTPEELAALWDSLEMVRIATGEALISEADGRISLGSRTPGTYLLLETGIADGSYYYGLEDGAKPQDVRSLSHITLFSVVATDEKDPQAGVKIDWVDGNKLALGEASLDDSEPHVIGVTNKKAADITALVTLKKVDAATVGAESGAPTGLQGAVYTVYRAPEKSGDNPQYAREDYTEKVSSRTSDQNGVMEFTGLTAGHYMVQETVPPTGYGLSDEVKYFELELNPYSKLLDFVLDGTVYPAFDTDGSAPHLDFDLGFMANDATDTPTGKFEITKVDSEDDSMVLEGAAFILYYKNGDTPVYYKGTEDGAAQWTDDRDEAMRLVTPQSGKLSVENLPYGHYFLEETAAPAGYELPDTPMEFDIDATRSDVREMVRNTHRQEVPLGALEITKADSEDHETVLAGAAFVLYKTEDDKTLYYADDGVWTETRADAKQFVTGKDGKLRIADLPYGTYYLEEVTAPVGYSLPDAPWTFEIDEDCETAEQTLYNDPVPEEKLGSLELTKVDSGNKQKVLTGAEFILYRKGAEDVKWYYTGDGFSPERDEAKTLASDESGVIRVNGLPLGTYYLEETKAPDGYVLPPIPFAVTLDEETPDVTGLLPNDGEETPTPGTGRLALVKVDSEDGDLALDGAKFVLRYVLDGKTLYYMGDVDGTAQFTDIRDDAMVLISQDYGRIAVNNLAPGEYAFEEIAAPKGYLLPENPVWVLEAQAGETVYVTAENSKEPEEPGEPGEPGGPGEPPPQTGDRTAHVIAVAIALAASAAVIVGVARRKREKK